MDEIKDKKMFRDELGGEIPQYYDASSKSFVVFANGDYSSVNFGKTKLLRDKLGGVIPNQIFDVASQKWIIGDGGGSGGGEGTDTELRNDFNAHVATIGTKTDAGHFKVDGMTVDVNADGQLYVVNGGASTVFRKYDYEIPATVQGQKEFIIPLTTFDPATDAIMSYHNTTRLTPGMYDIVNGSPYKMIKITREISEDTDKNKLFIMILKNFITDSTPEGAVSGNVIADGTLGLNKLTEELKKYITQAAQANQPVTRHWYTTLAEDPLDPTKKVFVMDFETDPDDFNIVVFNGGPLEKDNFDIVKDQNIGDYIRINSMRPIDYDYAEVQGYLFRGFKII